MVTHLASRKKHSFNGHGLVAFSVSLWAQPPPPSHPSPTENWLPSSLSSLAITNLFSISVGNCCLFGAGLLCHFLLCIFELSSLKYLQLAVPTSWITEVVLAERKEKPMSCAYAHTRMRVRTHTDTGDAIRGYNRLGSGRLWDLSLDGAAGVLVQPDNYRCHLWGPPGLAHAVSWTPTPRYVINPPILFPWELSEPYLLPKHLESPVLSFFCCLWWFGWEWLL